MIVVKKSINKMYTYQISQGYSGDIDFLKIKKHVGHELPLTGRRVGSTEPKYR